MPKQGISGGTVHTLPADLRAALRSSSKALAAWEDITPLARNEWICWVESVKKQETRTEHVERTVAGQTQFNWHFRVVTVCSDG